MPGVVTKRLAQFYDALRQRVCVTAMTVIFAPVGLSFRGELNAPTPSLQECAGRSAPEA
ncbi:MAG TPA: hypothetical protein VHK24_03400 [Steroidobacter sp.]|nr:hypothetical protein [Steroidobacter sp.]